MLLFLGGARDPLVPTILYVANVDTSEIKFVHCEEVWEIVCTFYVKIQKRLDFPTVGPISNFHLKGDNYEKK